jgi:hypothetical protein
VIRERDLQRGVDRFGSRVHEEDVVHALGRDVDDPMGRLECAGMSDRIRRAVVERSGLPGDRLDDPGPAVTGVHAPERRHRVHDLPAVRGGVVHVLCADHESRRLFERAVRGERHPERLEVERLEKLTRVVHDGFLRRGAHGF